MLMLKKINFDKFWRKKLQRYLIWRVDIIKYVDIYILLLML